MRGACLSDHSSPREAACAALDRALDPPEPRPRDLVEALELELDLEREPAPAPAPAPAAGRDRDRDDRPFGGTMGGRRRAANAAKASAALEGSSVDVISGVGGSLAAVAAVAEACGRGSQHISHSSAAGLFSNVHALHVHPDGGALVPEAHVATLRFLTLVRLRFLAPDSSEPSSARLMTSGCLFLLLPSGMRFRECNFVALRGFGDGSSSQNGSSSLMPTQTDRSHGLRCCEEWSCRAAGSTQAHYASL